MADLKYTGSKGMSLLAAAALVLCAMTAFAQSAKDNCGPTSVIPLTGEEPPAKIIIFPPLAEPLASRGVAIIQYCTQNLHLVPVFGPNALAVSPRVGHLHVTVDDASWVWADASGNPIILMGLRPGPHKVLIELADANHRILDKGLVTFVVPENNAAKKHADGPVVHNVVRAMNGAFRNQNSAARRQLPGLRHSARGLDRRFLEVARHSSKPA